MTSVSRPSMMARSTSSSPPFRALAKMGPWRSCRRPGSYKEVGVAHTVLLDGVTQGPRDRFPPDDFVETARTVPACEGGVGHGKR